MDTLSGVSHKPHLTPQAYLLESHSFIHPFIQQILTEHLQCPGSTLGAGNRNEQADGVTAIVVLTLRWEEEDSKP